LFALDVITLRALPLYLAPIVLFAIIVWAVLCAIAPPPFPHTQAELVGLLALLGAAICAFTAGRLYPRREVPDLRIPFFLNAAGLAVILGWFAISLLVFLWQSFIHRAA
jgi:hypothetical protein